MKLPGEAIGGYQQAMAHTHLDRKNISLAKTTMRLRQAIDVYRIIGINASAAKRLGANKISSIFFGYVQQVSLDMIALTICIIFQWEDPNKPYKQNSVSGILTRLEKHKYTDVQAKNVERFGRKYGNTAACPDPTQFLRDTVDAFKRQHDASLERLRRYRNTHVAHSQLGARVKSLPSIDDFEAIFDFAVDFYKLISDGILNIGPTGFPPAAGVGLVRTFKNLGLTDALFDFPPKP
jgi:hypothetical protein